MTESNQAKPERKKHREFSKSFEISLGDIDNLTDRVDSGIKFKRNKNPEATEIKEATIIISSNGRDTKNRSVNENENKKCKNDEQALELKNDVIESMKKVKIIL